MNWFPCIYYHCLQLVQTQSPGPTSSLCCSKASGGWWALGTMVVETVYERLVPGCHPMFLLEIHFEGMNCVWRCFFVWNLDIIHISLYVKEINVGWSWLSLMHAEQRYDRGSQFLLLSVLWATFRPHDDAQWVLFVSVYEQDWMYKKTVSQEICIRWDFCMSSTKIYLYLELCSELRKHNLGGDICLYDESMPPLTHFPWGIKNNCAQCDLTRLFMTTPELQSPFF